MKYEAVALTISQFWAMELRRIADMLDSGAVVPSGPCSINDRGGNVQFCWRTPDNED